MEKENTPLELFLSRYKFFQKEWQIDFDKTYPDLQLNGKSYNREENKEMNWLDYWHRFIDHLAEGKSSESFFAAL